jgi:hypothetical protein
MYGVPFTEGELRVTRAPTLLPDILLCGAMHERCVVVPDLAEKVYAVLSRKERRGDRVHGRVAPTLLHTPCFISSYWRGGGDEATTLPRSKIHRDCRGTRRMPSRPRRAKSPYRLSQSCSKLLFDDAYGSGGPAPLI